MKFRILIIFVLCFAFSCKNEKLNKVSENEQESINFVLKQFPFIDKKLEKIKKVEFNSLAISLYRNIDKIDYDEILVFQKGNKFYAIPFLSNMYYDFWNFKNEIEKSKFSKTNTTFEKELQKSAVNLKLSADEKQQVFIQLITSVLNTEDMLEKKPQMFEDFVEFSPRKSKYKDEEPKNCLERTSKLFKEILEDGKNGIRPTYIWDKENGRVYKLFNESQNIDEYNLRIETYRVDCYTTLYEM
ncbi:hypothetical protein MHJ94_02450 [Chryseobacterium taklimakanense]|uniref:Lipoprotein n=1 Tax=Chryseobacterium taklimakanense TaxID=536441 RepID=A0A239WRM8_9FLAO|nr:hypothetical protein [Chryseobacterium taklimakanense]MCG7280151.1 hypothetical protein [Chryseobacterium taklimakanense]SNV36478.1 Uncharacterised protein [Chryseobacterium taklimakanense]